jgi:excisionase family DNA binding protein
MAPESFEKVGRDGDPSRLDPHLLRTPGSARTAFRDDHRLLSLAEAAGILRVSRRSLSTLLSLGALPCIRVTRRRVLIAESDLVAFLDARRSRQR